MGRMLETLKHVPKSQPEQCVVDWTLREPDEVHFIEVGSGKKMEGSTEVMAIKHPPQTAPAVQPPHPPTEKILASTHKAVMMTEPKAMNVAFEPWPALLAPSRGIAAEVIAFHQPNHAVSRQYASLFGKITECQGASGTSTILFSGSRPNVGTTTALLNLAIVAATQEKRRLVLLDAHLLRPTLAQRLGLTAHVGLQEVLAGNEALEAAVVKTQVPGMFLLAARGEGNSSHHSLSTEALTWVLSWLKERFDLVLIDGPGLEEEAEITTLGSLCDGMYLVVPAGETAPIHRTMAQTIGRRGGRLKGLIHTQYE